MSRQPLLAITFIVSLFASTAKTETYDNYLNRLSQHPSVIHILEQSHSFDSLSQSAVGLPDPQLILGVENIPLRDPTFDEFLPSSKVIGFQQTIPNRKVREHKSSLKKSQSKKLRLMAEYQVQQLQSLFTRQLIELERVGQLEKLLKEQLKLYRLIEKDLRGQLEAGKAIYGRFSEIDVERSDIAQKLNELSAERINIQEILIELVERVPQVKPPIVSVTEWTRGETPLYPTLIAFDSIAVSKNKVDIAKAKFKPNYGFQAIYRQRESGSNFDGDDWFSIQSSISIPIWSKSSQTPKLKSAKAMRRSAQKAYEQSIRHWNQRMASLESEQKYALENINLFKKKKKSLKETISAAQRNYESGNTALEHVLNAQINHLKIAAKLISQQSRYQTLVIEFNSHIYPKITPLGATHADY